MNYQNKPLTHCSSSLGEQSTLEGNSCVAFQIFPPDGILTQPLPLRFLRIIVIELSAALPYLLGFQKLLNRTQAESLERSTVSIFGIEMSAALALLVDLSRAMKRVQW